MGAWDYDAEPGQPDVMTSLILTGYCGKAPAPRLPGPGRRREALAASGISLAAAIDPTLRAAAGVTFGTGNVICAFCHFGVGTVVGDNNFLSAFNSYDYHNRLGPDISADPACTTSGLVVLGDRVRLGDRRLGAGGPRRQAPRGHDRGCAAAQDDGTALPHARPAPGPGGWAVRSGRALPLGPPDGVHLPPSPSPRS